MRLLAIAAVTCFFLGSQNAAAAPITDPGAVSLGTFEWVYDALFQTGSSFNITNSSDSSFENVAIDLFHDGDTTSFLSLSLGAIQSGGFAQTIDDLSGLLVDDIGRAVVSFTIDGLIYSGALTAASLNGDPADFLAGSIDVSTSDVTDTTPVPEPSTLVLAGSALCALMLRTRRSRRQLPASLH